ncbi:MAG: hypothetical protein M1830_003999 [Pleopsidium flavum]|nr:MAG: hypothetical protein M1830_003999 [Pleopsidium flavum]
MSTAEAPGHRQDEVVGPATYSSSPDLSSPPKSPESPSEVTIPTATHTHPISHSHNSTSNVKVGGGVDKVASAPTTTQSLAKTSTTTLAAAPKKPRKKKDPTANGSSTTATDGKESKPKKSRAQPGTSLTARKKPKLDASANTKSTGSAASRQAKLSDLVGPSHNATITLGVPPRFASPQNGNSDAIPKTSLAFVGAGQSTPTSRSSGQNYDPIRSTTMEAPPIAHNPFSAPPVSPTPPRSTNRASASPSIASLIDPPAFTKSIPPIPFSQPMRQSSATVMSPTPTPLSAPSVPVPPSILQVKQPSPVHVEYPLPQTVPDQTVQIDTEKECLPPKLAPKKPTAGSSTGPSSSTASPKPVRQKEAPPPLPSGNGLLSSAFFGGPSDISTNGPDKTAPTVILHIPMNGETNKYINFARMAEERYGFNALHPRLAAQRERLARIAAAGAALEKGSGSGSADEMSLDLSEGESNVEMGGMEGGGATEGKKPPKKKKADQYDKDDPFVDDSELLWEEQAAASKDGFFVYSGPLVPEGEKPTIERADGTVKRGRGRGKGVIARGTGSARGGAAVGGGTATRGPAATRKPRVTKAARLLMEQEKLDREKMAVLAAKPSTYPG